MARSYGPRDWGGWGVGLSLVGWGLVQVRIVTALENLQYRFGGSFFMAHVAMFLAVIVTGGIVMVCVFASALVN